mmetsp:Transcript_32053/g.75178  ORF Transcript_32053/g.75178 Transcript_32053/m.75178 type:complete len:339 (+) Transcript_32053:107-1123(+)
MAKFTEGKNRVWRLRSRPVGTIADTDLELCVEDVPAIEDGQMLVRNLYFSIDPTHRIWMSDRPQYMEPVAINDIMRDATIGEVVESKHADYPVGTKVYGFGGLADYFVGTPGATVLYRAGETGLPLQADLSVASLVVGLAAWYGTRKVLNPGPEDVFVVSGGAGAVGSLAGQLAKVSGAKVIGIAGGAAKCAFMKNECGFDVAIDYKGEDVAAALKAAAPEGVTCYFDNVGGGITDAALANMRNNGKVAVCGSISEYDDKWTGWQNANMILNRRLTVQGFICGDHAALLQEAKAEIIKLVLDGKVKYAEDIQDGLENYPSVVRMLLSGANKGKLMIKA